jgi:hypothetical protein
MYWGERGRMGQSFACKLGLHPSILPRLSSITSNFENSVPKQPLNLLEDNSLYLNDHWTSWRTIPCIWMLQYTFYMYWGEREHMGKIFLAQ